MAARTMMTEGTVLGGSGVSATATTPPPDIFQQIGQAAGAAAHRVEWGVANTVAHPEYLPGDILNGVLAPLEGVAAGVGAIAGGQTQQDITRVIHEVNVTTERQPLAAGMVLGGGLLVATGAGTTAGLGLIAKGTATIAGAVLDQEAHHAQAAAAAAAQTGARQAATAAQLAPAHAAGKPGANFWEAFTRRR